MRRGAARMALLATSAGAAALVVLLALLWLRSDGGESASGAGQPNDALPAASRPLSSPDGVVLSEPPTAPRTATTPAPAPAPVSTPVEKAQASQGSLRVEVVGADGAGLEGLAVYVQRGAQERVEQFSDASGLARFPALEAGAWTVLAGDHERALAQTAAEVLAERDVLVRVELREPLTEVDVEVVDEAGRPAPGVELKTRCERGGVSRAVTDHAGRARLRHVSLGVVRVFATDERLGRGNRALEIGAGERPSIVIALATRDSVR